MMKSLKSVEGKPYFRSAISVIEPGYMNVRGYDLRDLIQHAHVIEEMRDGVPLRIVLDHDLEYTLPRETEPWRVEP
jgi:hypothetical protein